MNWYEDVDEDSGKIFFVGVESENWGVSWKWMPIIEVRSLQSAKSFCEALGSRFGNLPSYQIFNSSVLEDTNSVKIAANRERIQVYSQVIESLASCVNDYSMASAKVRKPFDYQSVDPQDQETGQFAEYFHFCQKLLLKQYRHESSNLAHRLKHLDEIIRWRDRLAHILKQETTPMNPHTLGLFKPHQFANSALMVLSKQYSYGISEIQKVMRNVESSFQNCMDSYSEEALDTLFINVQFLHDRLSDLILLIQNSEKEVDSSKTQDIETNRADWSADKPKKIADRKNKSPQNPDVLDLCMKLRQEADSGKSLNQIAREYTGGNKNEAQKLLRQAQRFRHLWKDI